MFGFDHMQYCSVQKKELPQGVLLNSTLTYFIDLIQEGLNAQVRLTDKTPGLNWSFEQQ